MRDLIKVGFCVAYDWYLLTYALPRIYAHADKICLSIDKDRISWSGNAYHFDVLAFHTMVEAIDTHNKITWQEEDFHLTTLSPMQNEVRQRNMIAAHLGKDGWHVQLDCDEYFLHFDKFVDYLHSLPLSKTYKANVCCTWIVVYKQVSTGYLYVDPQTKEKLDLMQIAMKDPHYEHGRRNGNFNIHTNFKVLHQSWAREEAEIKSKIYNWGHSQDIDKDLYYESWRGLNIENYKRFVNFHPLQPAAWPKLGYLEATSIDELIEKVDTLKFCSFSVRDLFFKNSRFFSRIRKIMNFFEKK